MRKHFSLSALVALVSFMFANVVLTSCSDQKYVEPEPEKVYTPGPTQYITVENTIAVGNYGYWDGENLYLNSEKAATASVKPENFSVIVPAADHKAPETPECVDELSWKERFNTWNGTKWTATTEMYTVMGAIEPANDPFATMTEITKKVSLVEATFRFKGSFNLTLSDGKKDYQQFDLPLKGMYFLTDSTTDVRFITRDSIQIITRDTTIIKEVPVEVHDTTYINVKDYVKVKLNRYLNNGVGMSECGISMDGVSLFKAWVKLSEKSIIRKENEMGIADILSAIMKKAEYSDTQTATIDWEVNGAKVNNVEVKPTSFNKFSDNILLGTVEVVISGTYTDVEGEEVEFTFTMNPSYFHVLENAEITPEVVTPEVKTTHTYDVDSTHTAVYQDGKLIGTKVKFTIKRDGETISKGQYLEWETGLASGTLTGTQVGGNVMLRPTVAPFEEYHADGWSGTEDFKGGVLTAYSLQFHFRTAFAAVPGFGQKEQSVAETNLVFCKRSFDFVDAENPEWEGVHWSVTGNLTVHITEDRVGSDEAAKAEVNGRGLEYEYIGTHYLSFDQFIGGVKVTSQHRAENLLYPKN